MAKVMMNSSFPVSGGKLWQIIDAFNARPGKHLVAMDNSRDDKSDCPDNRLITEQEVSEAIECSHFLGFEHLCVLSGR